MFIKNQSFKLCFWVSVLLIFNSGWVNSIVLYNVLHASVTYMTGNLSDLSHAIADKDITVAWHFLLILFGFFAGTIFQGFLVKKDDVLLSRRFSLCLIIQAVLMLDGLLLLNLSEYNQYTYYDLFFLAIAMGMQNSLTTLYIGTVARTTHLTGTITDLGIEIGKFIKKEPFDVQKAGLIIALIISFVLGGTLSSLWIFYAGHNYILLLFPSVIIPFFLGIVSFIVNRQPHTT